MSLDGTKRLYLERQVTLGRVILVALSLVTLLETSGEPVRSAPIFFLSGYLFLALAAALVERLFSETRFRIPLFADFLGLVVFLYLTPSVSAFWFLFLFAVFALANRGYMQAMQGLVISATVGIILRVARGDPFHWQSVWHWIAIGSGTLVSGLGMGFLGAREREHLARQQFLEKLTGQLRFDRGLTESIRQSLDQLMLAFECEQACLAVRDDDLERVFVWKVSRNDGEPQAPETLSLARADAFLLDCLEVSLCWEFGNGNGRGQGFAWDRRTGKRFRRVSPPPQSTHTQLGAQSVLAATLDAAGQPVGRILLMNPCGPGGTNGKGAPRELTGRNSSRGTTEGSTPPARNSSHLSSVPGMHRRRFRSSDLRWLEQIVCHLGPQLESVFLMRNLRARTIESERSRISRDLHDGILQTLLSLKIQLDVVRRKLPEFPEKVCVELTNLQKTIQQESDELRRMVTDMRPVRVESADMREMMMGFAERFRLEYAMEVDLFIDDEHLRLPGHLCRELFQIYREALHNVKKHAHASHVVVKLTQDESNVSLVVDDNGRGFSFSGRYSSEELDRLRFGPISIKERTRGVGGTLTIESNPGHGARLTVAIPLN